MMTSEIGVRGDRLSLSHAHRLVFVRVRIMRGDPPAGRVSTAPPAAAVNLQLTKIRIISMCCDIWIVVRTSQESRFQPPLRFAGAAPRHESDPTPPPGGELNGDTRTIFWRNQ